MPRPSYCPADTCAWTCKDVCERVLAQHLCVEEDVEITGTHVTGKTGWRCGYSKE